jgi:hypothetical protein
MSEELNKRLIQRIEQYGDASPGIYNLAADLFEIVSNEAWQWKRPEYEEFLIPKILEGYGKALRERATLLVTDSWHVHTGPPKLSTG